MITLIEKNGFSYKAYSPFWRTGKMPPGFSSASFLGVLFFREFDEHQKKDHTSLKKIAHNNKER